MNDQASSLRRLKEIADRNAANREPETAESFLAGIVRPSPFSSVALIVRTCQRRSFLRSRAGYPGLPFAKSLFLGPGGSDRQELNSTDADQAALPGSGQNKRRVDTSDHFPAAV